MKNWLNLKTLFRFGWLAYWSLIFFVSPWPLVALIPYGMMRLIFFADGSSRYKQWKMMKYGKNDKNLTVRKLYYILKTADKLSVKNASIYEYSDQEFDSGYLYVDDYLRIHMDAKDYTYEITLSFNGKKIATFTGYSFQKIKWDLEDLPEIKKALTKFNHQIEKEFERAKNESTKANSKAKKKQKELEDEKRKTLAKEVRQAYKKDMSI